MQSFSLEAKELFALLMEGEFHLKIKYFSIL